MLTEQTEIQFDDIVTCNQCNHSFYSDESDILGAGNDHFFCPICGERSYEAGDIQSAQRERLRRKEKREMKC